MSLSLVPSALRRLDKLKAAIESCTSVGEIKDLRGRVEALRIYIRQAGYGLEAQNAVAEIKLRAERKAGELLSKTVCAGNPQLSNRTTIGLRELGISRDQSSCWQLEASVPEDEFARYVERTKKNGDELTSVGLLMLAKRLVPPTTAAMPRIPTGKFRCIVLDPPWPLEKIERRLYPMQGKYLDYPTLKVDAISALPISTLAWHDCHVYLWATQRFVPSAFDLFEKWGVRYQCLLTWVKPFGPCPFSWLYNTEHVLFGRIGHLPLLRQGVKLSFEERATKHSRKPDRFYDIVRKVSPEPRLDMFAREHRSGFEAWGNEIR